MSQVFLSALTESHIDRSLSSRRTGRDRMPMAFLQKPFTPQSLSPHCKRNFIIPLVPFRETIEPDVS